jgi:hypothetical protein
MAFIAVLSGISSCNPGGDLYYGPVVLCSKTNQGVGLKALWTMDDSTERHKSKCVKLAITLVKTCMGLEREMSTLSHYYSLDLKCPTKA